LVKIVDDNLRVRVPFQLDDYTRVLVRFVPDRRDIGQDLVVHERRNALNQGGAVYVVRDLRDDDLFAIPLQLLDARLAADLHAAAARLEVLLDAREPKNGAAGGEV